MIDTFGCIGSTIKVAAGHYFDLRAPSLEMVDLQSIASALSKLCRFGCHCPTFYSVAEHSVLATRLAQHDGIDVEVLRAILMHDAAEAYVGDVVKPLKNMLKNYVAIEASVERAIIARFNLRSEHYRDTVKHYDRQMLKSEKMTMWPEDTEKWAGFHSLPNRDVEFGWWGHVEAELKFLAMAEELGIR